MPKSKIPQVLTLILLDHKNKKYQRANRDLTKKESILLGHLPFFLSRYQDSNLGPPAPKAGALAGLRYTSILRLQR